jgi:hypothetical protein
MRLLATLVVSMLLIPFASGQSPQRSSSPPFLRIGTYRDGSITADGTRVTVEQLKAKIRDLIEHKGTACYYREDPYDDPTPNVRAVLTIFRRYHFFPKLSRSPDCSDVH